MAASGTETHPVPTLGELARLADARVVGESASALATGVTDIGLDSQTLPAGALFAAVPGTRVHGAAHAFDSPAGAILTDEDGLAIISQTDERRPVLVVKDVRAILGRLSAEIYGHPSRGLTVLGVTGTSGKTTTTYLLEAGLMNAGHRTGIIGTTGTRINGRAVETKLTTPEAPTLQRLFATMRAEGVTHVVMEVSSHALELGRVTGVEFDVAGFTNLSQDHLDFHPTMAEYFDAKARFFRPDSELTARTAVVCVDDDWGERMASVAGEGVVRVGTRGQERLDYSATRISQDASGAQELAISHGQTSIEVHMPLPGSFNIANTALAVAMAVTAGVEPGPFVEGLAQVAVPGRMERIDQGQDFMAVVDYAHKPAAVAAVLETLRSQADGRVGIVVGAGGDRDPSKRPLMGREAARRADLVIVTDDNPRSEEPGPIRAAIRTGAEDAGSDAEIREIASRADAIDELIRWARSGDAVVVTGKGHEVGQIVGSQVLHFDDREEVRRALAERAAKENQ